MDPVTLISLATKLSTYVVSSIEETSTELIGDKVKGDLGFESMEDQIFAKLKELDKNFNKVSAKIIDQLTDIEKSINVNDLKSFYRNRNQEVRNYLKDLIILQNYYKDYMSVVWRKKEKEKIKEGEEEEEKVKEDGNQKEEKALAKFQGYLKNWGINHAGDAQALMRGIVDEKWFKNYDDFINLNHLWLHEGYEQRQKERENDLTIIVALSHFSKMYFELEESKSNLKCLSDALQDFLEFYEANKVVKKSDEFLYPALPGYQDLALSRETKFFSPEMDYRDSKKSKSFVKDVVKYYNEKYKSKGIEVALLEDDFFYKLFKYYEKQGKKRSISDILIDAGFQFENEPFLYFALTGDEVATTLFSSDCEIPAINICFNKEEKIFTHILKGEKKPETIKIVSLPSFVPRPFYKACILFKKSEKPEEDEKTAKFEKIEKEREEAIKSAKEPKEGEKPAEEPKKSEEAIKPAEEPKKPEEAIKPAEEPKKPEEAEKPAEEPKKPEEPKKTEVPKKAEETEKPAEEPKKAEEAEKPAEEPKKTEEGEKPAEEPKKTEEGEKPAE